MQRLSAARDTAHLADSESEQNEQNKQQIVRKGATPVNVYNMKNEIVREMKISDYKCRIHSHSIHHRIGMPQHRE
jgi:hypothetical protein